MGFNKINVAFALLLFAGQVLTAQNKPVNVEESNIPAYQLPELLVPEKGADITSISDWEQYLKFAKKWIDEN